MKAYLQGFIYGDGAVYSRKNVKDYTVDIEQKNKKFVHIIQNLFKLEYGKEGRITTHKGLWRLRIYSKQVFEEFAAIKRFPIKAFRNLSDSDKILFISGLIDAEGNISRRRLRISNSNKELLTEIKNFLEKMGINCGKVYPNTKERRVWILGIYGKELRKLTKLLKLYNKKPPPRPLKWSRGR